MHWLLGCPDDTRRIEKRAFTAQSLEADMVWKALGAAPGVLRMIYKQFRYQGSDKGGKAVQRILIGTKHKASGLQVQNWMHGPIFAITKYRAKLGLISKTIEDMHHKNLCILS